MTSPKPLRLLFVDDDTDESYLFNEALEQSGHPITLSRAHDGNELIDSLKSGELPDLILMDINMPYKDGIEALEEIRSNHVFDKIITIIYSITREESAVKKAYDKGADLFLKKPEDFDGMLAVVKKLYDTDWTKFTRPGKENFVLTVSS